MSSERGNQSLIASYTGSRTGPRSGSLLSISSTGVFAGGLTLLGRGDRALPRGPGHDGAGGLAGVELDHPGDVGLLQALLDGGPVAVTHRLGQWEPEVERAGQVEEEPHVLGPQRGGEPPGGVAGDHLSLIHI